MRTAPEIALIAAIGKGRELGKDNRLLWHIKEDLQRFKRLTVGHPLIMGRKTFESIGKPLPDRVTIVVTRDKNWGAEGARVSHSLEEALALARTLDGTRVCVGGGSEIYAQALPHADKLYLTLIEDEKDADAFFPVYEHLFTEKISEESHTTDTGLRYRWVDLTRG